ncbi:SDR family NAD(P)-dependent oxidoreductase [Neisseria sp. Ec49-e6-T10]|uniref:SDR family NAD(P)-dependent oxidoreductase n=1 Tax=Neisseria sp. Ec49-e6-T10 TaxID=3140744 RepID=UPI003EC0F9A6
MRLQNKVAVITGAATGIGRATALLFAQEGAKLVLTDVNEVGVQEVVNEIKQLQGQAIAIKHDVTKEDDWQKVAQKTVEEFQRIDILFNNAGIYIIKPLVDIELQEWNNLMAINVTGPFLGMKHIIPIMANQKSGSVINASSIAGLRGAAGHALYGASKGAVRTMTKDVAIEYAADNVRVNSIHPGYIKTEMVQYAAQKSHKTLEEIGAAYPLKRLGEVEDVAKTVLFLASDDAAYTTGCEFIIDGGVTSKA